MTKAYIGIGSNIGDAVCNVNEAISRLSDLGRVLKKSSLYATKPWGVLDQPDFINAAVALDTNLGPRDLLNGLLAIERSMGRERLIRWGPRIIDLDILTFANQTVSEDGLTIPHPHMNERAFVLMPLAEIDENYAEALKLLPDESRVEVRLLG
ncbi:MAG: 2-amino-4-hydroxy-6-hydroxymethyldihydropteridine diphosphokinase [Cyanobacteria bacterium PR.023]|jgi:2-amino-4-hydroxy-6-hydroxymethyldihydropteridine diphosphokinase|nr:2-amino-4-hydroxy-6-hydroxymethyldihydropteridine diphosphokinase [Cyanobacteria bacterium PR.023]